MDDNVKEFELTVFDRLNLLGILPAEGNLITLRLVREFKESLSFSEEEIALLKLEYLPDNIIRWDKEIAPRCVKKLKISKTIHEMIKSALIQLDKQSRLKDVHLDLYERFVGNGD